jgi:hypothetical protein
MKKTTKAGDPTTNRVASEINSKFIGKFNVSTKK